VLAYRVDCVNGNRDDEVAQQNVSIFACCDDQDVDHSINLHN
jgi:hypothetical protein